MKDELPQSPKEKRPVRRFVYGLFGAMLFLALGGFFLVKSDTSFAANFTDQVLRPAIGDRQVIFLEGAYFQLLDIFHRIKYAIVAPQNLYVASNTVPLVASDTVTPSSTFTLAPIAVSGVTSSAAGAGVWRGVPLDAFPGKIVMADTFVNPDPQRSYAFVTLVKMDMSQLRLWAVAGTQEPGGKVGKPGPGVVPAFVQKTGSLISAFNGGFQYSDGQYGMIVGATTYVPLKKNLATLVAYADGRVEIVNYEGQNLGKGVVFVRQNCPMLIENGVIATTDQSNKSLWGRTVNPGIYTWRSGLGVTAHGNLIYAVGNSLTPTTLAAALKAAGAVNAMQLDINPYWVRFDIFNGYQNGHYSDFSIMKGMQDGSYNYLHGYQKDFFYITKKA
jgi:hypothetical protein